MTTDDIRKQILPVLFITLAIGSAYFLGLQKVRIEPQTQIQAINVDEVAVKGLVVNFYKAMENQDGKLLFNYVTKPLTLEEKKGFDWLTGADLKEEAFYRVFLRVKIFSPRIDDVQKVDDNTYIVRVTDQIRGYSNAQDVGWDSPKPRYDILLTVVKLDGTWFVDKFRNPSDKKGTEKYNGFSQGM
jgi:hypothetical protein